jgi:hypothetical protein
LEGVTDIVESDAMSHLGVAERDNMAPLVIGASLLIHSGLPGQLGYQVAGNIVAKLAENGEFGGGWKFYVFHDLPCGRFSSNFQPFFLNSCGMAVN